MFAPASRVARPGAAAVEFAAVLPLLLLLLLGVLEVGRAVQAKQVLTNAAREGGRLASLGKSQADVDRWVKNYLRDAGLPTHNTAVDPLVSTAEATGETSVRVRVTLPLRDVRWVSLSVLLNPDARLEASSVWVRQ